MVIGHLAVQILVLAQKFFPHKPDMDAPHGAACAGCAAQQRRVGKVLARNALNVGIACLLQIPAGQGLIPFNTATFSGVPRS